MKAIVRKNEEIDKDMKTELQNKLNSKRSIDKPTSKFLYIGRRKNRKKVVSFDFCFTEMLNLYQILSKSSAENNSEIKEKIDGKKDCDNSDPGM